MMNKTIDIYSKGDYPANVLSNFYPIAFKIDGVECQGMEGFLQSLKFKSIKAQTEVCALSGKEAKGRGQRKRLWKLTGRVYWQGRRIQRCGEEFSALILRAYREMAKQSEEFRRALISTDGAKLTHTIGKHRKRQTILTEEEFIFCLTTLRDELMKNNDCNEEKA